VLRSKLELDRSKGSKRHTDVKRDVMANSGAEMQSVSSASSHDYIPPWFERYIEYKFNLLDRAGLVCLLCMYTDTVCVSKLIDVI